MFKKILIILILILNLNAISESKNEKRLFTSRYKRFNEKTWNDVFKRVASEIGGKDSTKVGIYYDLMSNGYFMPSSPQLWNFGTDIKNGSSCFTMGIGDTLEEIYFHMLVELLA